MIPVTEGLLPSGFVSRAAALVVDALALAGATSTAGYVLSALAAVIPAKSLFGMGLDRALPVGAGALVVLLYFVFCWSAFGRTLGMALMGLKVVTVAGGRVSAPRAVFRFVGFLVAGAVAGLGFLWVLVDDRRMAWHDHLAGTIVVRVHRRLGAPHRRAVVQEVRIP